MPARDPDALIGTALIVAPAVPPSILVTAVVPPAVTGVSASVAPLSALVFPRIGLRRPGSTGECESEDDLHSAFHDVHPGARQDGPGQRSNSGEHINVPEQKGTWEYGHSVRVTGTNPLRLTIMPSDPAQVETTAELGCSPAALALIRRTECQRQQIRMAAETRFSR